MNNEYAYKINTGYIFERLKREWRKYNRDFLKQDVEEALFCVLMDKKISTYSSDGGINAEFLEHYLNIRFPHELKEAEDLENFPFPDFFLKEEKGLPCVVYYRELCEV